MNIIYKPKANFRHLIALFLVAVMPAVAWADQLVTGVVTGTDNEPLIGVTILLKNSTVGTTTNLDGEYSLSVPANGTLVFSYIGMQTQEIRVNKRSRINVVMQDDSKLIDEIVVVGYGTQVKKSVTGAVASIRSAEIVTTKNENPQNMLTGKIPGLRVWQKSAEPGTFSNNLDIRGLGAPLVIIDGVPRSTEDFQRLNANDIDDVSVLKDASAAIYGVRAANGVLLVTTKKGKAGKAVVNLNASYTFQTPASMPSLADPYQTMDIWNEKNMNNINGGSILYGPEVYEEYRNGTRRSSDWNKLVLSDVSPQSQADLSISGGTEKTKYYIGMGYFFQEGFFKSGDLNYNKFNVRSNISSEIARGLTFDLNLSAVADERNNPYSSTVDIIKNLWAQGALMPAYADPDNTMLSYQGLNLDLNTAAMMNADISGSRKYKQKYFQSSAALNYDFGTITSELKGLTAKALFSFDYRMDNNTSFRKEYSLYGYDKNTDSYIQKAFANSSPNRLRREMFDKQQMLAQFIVNYDRTFAEKHKVGGLVGWEVQKREGDNFFALRELAFGIPYLFAGVDENQASGMAIGNNDLYELANQALIGRLNYGYDNRYLIEAQFRYDGSSKFAKGHQWGFFPSVSAGWRVSEEAWFKNMTSSIVDQLKLRASYGILGDDGSLEGDWITGFKYPSTNSNADNGYYNQYAPGYVFDGKFIYAAEPMALPNEKITWFQSHTFNAGVDFSVNNGIFGFAFDYFNRYREGRFARRAVGIPTVVGATAPRENLDSDRHFGLELELNHRHKVGDFSYNIKGIFAVTRQKYEIASEKGPFKNSYDKWRNDNLTERFQGVQFGYVGAGRYTSWDDIRSYTIYKDRNVLPGDYKYLDWNGDGEINGNDEHPYAFDQTPWMNFSLSFGANYKKFDLSILFQGTAMGSMEYKEPLYAIWGEQGGGTLVQYLDRWHPVDPTADPYDPTIEWVQGYYGFSGNYPHKNSSFNRVSTAYLRLKSVELGYTLPKINALKGMGLRVFANAYNLFTLTGVKFVDPEHPDDDLGRMYPLNRTFTLGLALSF